MSTPIDLAPIPYEMPLPASSDRLHRRQRLHLVGYAGVSQVTRLIPRRDRTVVPIASSQGTLALDLRQPPGLPTARDLRLVSGDQVPSCRVWASRFAQAIVDVVAGDRSPQQVVRCTTKVVYDDLLHRSSVVRRAAQAQPRQRRLRAVVRSVHISHPVPTAAEIAIHVRHGRRSRAIAARVEWVGGRWICTALQFG